MSNSLHYGHMFTGGSPVKTLPLIMNHKVILISEALSLFCRLIMVIMETSIWLEFWTKKQYLFIEYIYYIFPNEVTKHFCKWCFHLRIPSLWNYGWRLSHQVTTCFFLFVFFLSHSKMELMFLFKHFLRNKNVTYRHAVCTGRVETKSLCLVKSKKTLLAEINVKTAGMHNRTDGHVYHCVGRVKRHWWS